MKSRKWQPTPVLLPGKFHGLRSLVGYSPWGRKELDMTERLHFQFLSLYNYTQYPVINYKGKEYEKYMYDTYMYNWITLLYSRN